MNADLGRELLEYPFRYSHSSLPAGKTDSQTHPTLRKDLKRIKAAFLGIVVVSFLSYRLLSYGEERLCVYDLTHELTVSLNRLINEEELFYQVVLTVAQ